MFYCSLVLLRYLQIFIFLTEGRLLFQQEKMTFPRNFSLWVCSTSEDYDLLEYDTMWLAERYEHLEEHAASVFYASNGRTDGSSTLVRIY